MNSKKAKLVRLLCKAGSLNYTKQKKIFKSLTPAEQVSYVADARIHILIAKRDKMIGKKK